MSKLKAVANSILTLVVLCFFSTLVINGVFIIIDRLFHKESFAYYFMHLLGNIAISAVSFFGSAYGLAKKTSRFAGYVFVTVLYGLLFVVLVSYSVFVSDVYSVFLEHKIDLLIIVMTSYLFACLGANAGFKKKVQR